MDKVLPPEASEPLAATAAGVLGASGTGLVERLGGRSVVLVGLMGAGKSTIGRRLALRTGLPFYDADTEIETAAGMPIADIFTIYGEPAFRDGERRVISRLLEGPPIVLATGGGAYMDPETRARIRESAISVWLKADHETLMRRVRKRSHRPLLQTADPDATMRRLMAERDPVYAQADVTVLSRDSTQDRVVQDVLAALSTFMSAEV
ncbi:shikimate kinase [Enterovirga sp.]|jgi:shikimate kinase|uniref:shikimate kinase n=1 Tax=Enterovirga sp. TaxID=2026350 RepID=UPI0026039AEE|nr:shikimate kinase [Enterovirga sp.]MDB5591638.1 Shikimate kinase [Enterovirga sp.]